MSDIFVLHGPNLNLLGEREIDIYGNVSLEEINNAIRKFADKAKVKVEIVQTNDEGDLINNIQEARNRSKAIIVNPGALTHYSYSLRDALGAVNIPVIEVHISNIYAREDWRQKSVTAGVAIGIIAGFGADSYLLAMQAALQLMKKNRG